MTATSMVWLLRQEGSLMTICLRVLSVLNKNVEPVMQIPSGMANLTVAKR